MEHFRSGLVVGKFAPLHLGHELLIRRALASCERLHILSYTQPEFEGCAPAVRQRWLRQRFPAAASCVLGEAQLRDGALSPYGFDAVPHNDEPASTHRRFVGAVCVHHLGVRIDAVFTSEDYGDGFAAELTRFYRQTDADYPPITHVCVDLARAEVAISGTRVRADVHGAREYLAPEVYATFVERVVLLGGESTGKSTLAQALAQHFDTELVEEYGRELWVERAGDLRYEDMLTIAREQVRRERAARVRAKRYLFCDTSALTTLFYSGEMFGSVASELQQLARRGYHHTFLCAPDFDFVQDGTRRDASFRAQQHDWYRRELARRGFAYTEVTGTVAERVAQVVRRLDVA